MRNPFYIDTLMAYKRENWYTVEPKTATSQCVHFEFAASPMEKKKHKKKSSLLHVSILGYFEIVEVIGQNTQKIKDNLIGLQINLR